MFFGTALPGQEEMYEQERTIVREDKPRTTPREAVEPPVRQGPEDRGWEKFPRMSWDVAQDVKEPAAQFPKRATASDESDDQKDDRKHDKAMTQIVEVIRETQHRG